MDPLSTSQAPLRAGGTRFLSAFTLVETLVVCGVVGILVALLFPAYRKVGETSQRVKCTSNLRSIGSAILSVAADQDGKFPALGRNSGEQKPTWGMKAAEAMGIDLGAESQRTVFWCPADRTMEGETGQYMHKNHQGHSSYAVNVNLMDWEEGVGSLGGAARGGIGLGQVSQPAKTLMVVENHKANNAIGWADQGGKTWQRGWTFEYTVAGGSEADDPGKRGYHQEANNWLFVDGHIETMKYEETLSPTNLWKLNDKAEQ